MCLLACDYPSAAQQHISGSFVAPGSASSGAVLGRPPHLCVLTCLLTHVVRAPCALCACRLLCLFGAGGEHLHTLGADSGTAQLQQLSWLGDNEVLACSGEEVTVWQVSQEQYKELRTYAVTNKAPIRHIATSPNGRFIAAACDNGVVSKGAAGRAGKGGCCLHGRSAVVCLQPPRPTRQSARTLRFSSPGTKVVGGEP